MRDDRAAADALGGNGALCAGVEPDPEAVGGIVVVVVQAERGRVPARFFWAHVR